jgi:hypothetical protein
MLFFDLSFGYNNFMPLNPAMSSHLSFRALIGIMIEMP